MITRICSCYFSATGNTECVVKALVENLSEKLGIDKIKHYNFTPKMMRDTMPEYGEGDLVIFANPVYAGRVPNLLLPFLKQIKGAGALGIPVVTYGNRNFDDALIELANLMKDGGIKIVAGGAFIGEHSFSTILGKGRPDVNDLKIVVEFAGKLADKLNRQDYSEVTVPGNDPIRPYYTPRDRNENPINILKVKPKTNKKICIDCKICAKLCPLQAIDYNDVSNVPGKCMKCCACEKKCPTGAKYFDDAGYIYHRTELEEMYAGTRREPVYVL